MKIENYKNLPSIECVYGLTFDKKKFYIGSTINLNDRMRRHFYYLKTNSHHSSKLQRAFNKYKNLKIIILDLNVEHSDLSKLEIDYIREYNSVIHGYNMIEDSKTYKTFKQSKTAIDNFKRTRSKSILQLDLYGNIINEYGSVSDAASAIDDQSSNISKCCNLNINRFSKRKGYVFIYKTLYDPTKDYTYVRYRPKGKHLEKIKEKAKNNKRCKKIINTKTNKIYDSISSFEKANGLYEGYVKYYFKNINEFCIKNEVYKIL